MSGLPVQNHDTSVWLEAGPSGGLGLRIAIPISGNGLTQKFARGFWIELVDASGQRVAWLRMRFVGQFKHQAVVEAVEVRPADDPAPPRSDVLLPVSAYRMEGCAL